MKKNCPAANAAIEQMLEDLKAAKAELLNTLTQTRQDLAEVAAAAEEMEELMFDETTWHRLTSFIEAVGTMQHLRKHAKSKKEFAQLRELESLVNKGVKAFQKSLEGAV